MRVREPGRRRAAGLAQVEMLAYVPCLILVLLLAMILVAIGSDRLGSGPDAEEPPVAPAGPIHTSGPWPAGPLQVPGPDIVFLSSRDREAMVTIALLIE